jgi:hypothetical protein
MTAREYERDPKLDHLRNRYGFADWAEPGTPPESLFIWRYVPTRDDLPGYELERIDVIEERDQPALTQSIWRSQTDRYALVESLIAECPDRTSARIALLRTLGQFQAYLELRKGLGDVGFAAEGDGAIVFALANLVVLLRTIDGEPLPVSRSAQNLEHHMRGRPDAGRPVAPTFNDLAAGAPQADGTIPISIEATDPLGRPLWFKMFGQEGEALERNGELAFRPYGPKRWELTVFAINENGASSEKTLSASAR